MTKEIEDALHMLLHCALKDKEYTTQKGQFTIVRKYIEQLEQALNEIKEIINACKKLMPHEFDWEEQLDNILQIIDKVGGNE